MNLEQLGKTTADAFNRMTLITTHYETTIQNLLTVRSYIDPEIIISTIRQHAIWVGIRKTFFDIFPPENVKYSKAGMVGGGNSLMLFVFLLILLQIASANIVPRSSSNYIEELDKSFKGELGNVKTGSIVISEFATNIFGFKIKWGDAALFKGIIKNFDLNNAVVSSELADNCVIADRHNPGATVQEYSTGLEKQTLIEYVKVKPSKTSEVACHFIPKIKYFQYDEETGELKYAQNKYTLSDIKNALSISAINMFNEIKAGTADDLLKNAYNQMTVIINSLDEIDSLINLRGLPEIIADLGISAKDRAEVLEQYLKSIHTLLQYAADMSGKSNVDEYLRTRHETARAKDAKDIAEQKSNIIATDTEGERIISEAVQRQSRSRGKNLVNENTAYVEGLGQTTLNKTVNAANAIATTAGDVLSAPLKTAGVFMENAKQLLLDNKLMVFLALLGLGATGYITLQINRGVITVIGKILLFPITIPYYIGEFLYEKIFYSTTQVTSPSSNAPTQLRIEAPPAAASEYRQAVRQISAKEKKLLDRINMLSREIERLHDDRQPSGLEQELREDLLRRDLAKLDRELFNLQNEAARLGRGITRRVKRSKKNPTKNRKYGKLRKLTKHKKRGTKKK